MKTEAPITERLLSAWEGVIDINDKLKFVEDDLFESHRALELELEAAKVKLGERKTVHQWLNGLKIPTREATGKPMCLLRRLSVALKVSPHAAPGIPPECSDKDPDEMCESCDCWKATRANCS